VIVESNNGLASQMEGSEDAVQPNTTITRVRTDHASKDSFLTPIGGAGGNNQAIIKPADGNSSFNNTDLLSNSNTRNLGQTGLI